MLTVLTPVKEPGEWLTSYLDWVVKLPNWVKVIVIIKSEFFEPDQWNLLLKNHRVIVSRDSGMYSALNYGLQEVKTEYVTYVNIDDTIKHIYFDRLFPFLERSSYDFIYTDYILDFGRTRRYFKSNSVRYLKSKHHLFTSQQGIVWRINDMRFNSEMKYAADTEFFLRYLSGTNSSRIMHINGYYAVFRIHENNLSNNKLEHSLEHNTFIGGKEPYYYLLRAMRWVRNLHNIVRWYFI